MIIDNIKKLLLGILTVLILLSVCAAADYADDDTITNLNESRIILNDTYVSNGTYYVGIEKDTTQDVGGVVVEKPKLPLISITSKPSCGCRYSYTWHTKKFVNYCPYCHKYNVLYNAHKWPARHEQELTCKKCGSDWCGCCGKEKYSWSKRYLTKA